MATSMSAQHSRSGEGADQAFPMYSTTGLQDIITASPAIVSVLPGLMRSMAAEIEKMSHAHPAPDALQHHAYAGAEFVARRVVTEISTALGYHLAHGHGPEAAGKGQDWVRLDAPFHEPIQAGSPTQGPRLQLKLLGTPEITLNGVRLRAVERCSRAALIMYVLALHPQGLSSDRLAAYIAADSADVDAFDTDASMRLGAVRTFVWRLRKVARWPDIVVSPEDLGGMQNRYRLPDNTTCDLWEFESSLDKAAALAVRANLEPGAADRAAALRQDAILLYRGEFCKGIGAGAIAHAAGYLHHRYVQAVMLQATYWKDKALRLQEAHLGRLGAGSAAVEEEHAWWQALSNYRLAARVEPYNESAHQGALLCQAHLGRGNLGPRREVSHALEVAANI
jgi:hypothetical protein